MKRGNSLASNLARVSVLFAIVLVALPLRSEDKSKSAPPADEEFFIISSVDAQKQRIVLKRPTEVTELDQINEKTAYRDEQGKAIEFKNLRSGDTVYVASSRGPDAIRIASLIRKGPMTVEELHRRYLPFK